MSAMPERVIVEESGGMLYAWYDEDQCAEPGQYYVPESRLREVEAEREREANVRQIVGGHRDDLQRENTALRAELDALVPLARWALGFNDTQDWPENLTIEQTAAARAILDRLDREAP